MAVINLGSINIDHLYRVEHFVQPGETLSSSHYQKQLGGKGANQSIALVKAGTEVLHVGRIHQQDADYKQNMIRQGVDCKYVTCADIPTGHAIIQVTPSGENAIVLFAGANQALTGDDLIPALKQANPGDWVLTQNETSAIEALLRLATEKGLKVAFNPAPMTESVKRLPHDCINLLIVNEVEASEISGSKDLDEIEAYFRRHWPHAEVLITLGKKGVRMLKAEETLNVPAFQVKAIDTTAAGDTFIGFFLSSYSQHGDAKRALTRACAASALAVTCMGAAQSIPDCQAVDQFIQQQG